MTVDIDDTIAAIASAPGSGLRGIVRLSGPNTLRIIQSLFGVSVKPELDGNQQLSVAMNVGDNVELPGELLIWPTDRSYTRQPSAEFHTLGSRPLLELALKRFCESGCRIARPGEFTLRAFLGGRLDLTQAEAVLAAIDSTEEKHFDLALQQLAGGLARPLDRIRNRLIDLLAELEAGLDFVEEDIEFVSRQQTLESLQRIHAEVQAIQSQIGSRSSSDTIYLVALVGLPNVGKSSLFNCLIQEPLAIVANVAGTTRDYVTATVEKEGLSIRLIDTAGLISSQSNPNEIKRQLSDESETSPLSIEDAAQSATWSQLESAELKLFCMDVSRPMTLWEQEFLDQLEGDPTWIVVLNKCDLSRQVHLSHPHICTSTVAKSSNQLAGQLDSYLGIDALWDQIGSSLMQSSDVDREVVGSTLIRCREHIDQTLAGLEAAKEAAKSSLGEEIVAAEIRHSLEYLGQIVGTVYTDDILDRIFGRFCIGK